MAKVKKSRFAKSFAYTMKSEALYALEKFSQTTMRIVMKEVKMPLHDDAVDRRRELSIPRVIAVLLLLVVGLVFLFQEPEQNINNVADLSKVEDISPITVVKEDDVVTINIKDDALSEPEYISHTVVKGDTLWHIARHYLNDPYKYPDLVSSNAINNADLIYPGNVIRIVRGAR